MQSGHFLHVYLYEGDIGNCRQFTHVDHQAATVRASSHSMLPAEATRASPRGGTRTLSREQTTHELLSAPANPQGGHPNPGVKTGYGILITDY